tara:strand:+ start:25066 stop:25734 length:669 start_codon:yes stop_codon:yes gene_type:complete
VILSHKKKFVFLATTKTASSSVSDVLQSSLGGDYLKKISEDFQGDYGVHINAPRLKGVFEDNGWPWEEYFKFAFVRNPWDRVISAYNYRKKTLHMWKSHKSVRGVYMEVPDMWIEHCLSLCDSSGELISLRRLLEQYGAFEREQYQYAYDLCDNKIIDFVGKVENLQEDFNTICDKIGIPKQQLPYVNKSKHKHYTEYYDDETRQIVAEKYAKDIEYFGYEY